MGRDRHLFFMRQVLSDKWYHYNNIIFLRSTYRNWIEVIENKEIGNNCSLIVSIQSTIYNLYRTTLSLKLWCGMYLHIDDKDEVAASWKKDGGAGGGGLGGIHRQPRRPENGGGPRRRRDAGRGSLGRYDEAAGVTQKRRRRLRRRQPGNVGRKRRRRRTFPHGETGCKGREDLCDPNNIK
jgi:hypothetical protein